MSACSARPVLRPDRRLPTVTSKSCPAPKDVCSVFARMSRHCLIVPDIKRYRKWRSRGRNGTAGHLSGIRRTLSSVLLIRGFGVQVPGGAPVLTWGFYHPFRLVDDRSQAMFAPRLLVSPDLVHPGPPRPGGFARPRRRTQSRHIGHPPGTAPSDGVTQRETRWQAHRQESLHAGQDGNGASA
jgi:hypothetical protein